MAGVLPGPEMGGSIATMFGECKTWAGEMQERCFSFPLLVLWLLLLPVFTSQALDVSQAAAWYDTLGYPNVKDLPYVRVATGSFVIWGNKPPENRFVEGFLTGKDADGFTVFLCSVSDFQDRFGTSEPYPPLITKHFVQRLEVPAHQRVAYEVLDFPKVVEAVLARLRDIGTGPKEFRAREAFFAGRYPGLRPLYNLEWGRPLSHRARIFAFARACQQKGIADAASEMFEIAAHIPDEQTNEVNPEKLRDALQQRIGEALLTRTEGEFGNPSVSLADLLKVYEPFAERFPANSRVSYAREATDLLKKMIAEEAAHHPKPLDQMSPDEQVAENIYQLRNLGSVMWIMYQRYPLMVDTQRGADAVTPVHRLVDLGMKGVPQLLDALEDRRFTRSLEPEFNARSGPYVLRVSDVARRILEHLSGRNFWTRPGKDGRRTTAETRRLAEAWWAEVKKGGEKESLIATVSGGGDEGVAAARRLVEKFPDDVLPAIEAGIRASREPGNRSEFVEIAGTLPGDKPVEFLRIQLTSEHNVYSRVQAAQALLRRGSFEAVPAIIEAWYGIQSRLPRNQADAFSEVGRIISFLARSGDEYAINALAKPDRNAPVQVRLALVEVFENESFNGGGSGEMVTLYDHVDQLPPGKARAAIEHLLVTALDDTERCFGPEGNFPHVSFKDPRVCDMAAFVLSVRWPEKYSFGWPKNSTECDGQIAKMRDRWRADHGLPPSPPSTKAAVAVPAVAESDVAPLLDAFEVAATDAERSAPAQKIVETFGLGALPAVRVRLEKSKNDALRSLAIQLASIVREVRVESDPGGMAAKAKVAELKGHVLNGESLDRLAHEMESAMPVDVSVVTCVAERAGDGAGFTVTFAWLPGNTELHAGWHRQLAVRLRDDRIFWDGGWTAEHAMDLKLIYRRFTAAFGKALQAEPDAPVFVRFRLQRGPAGI